MPLVRYGMLTVYVCIGYTQNMISMLNNTQLYQMTVDKRGLLLNHSNTACVLHAYCMHELAYLHSLQLVHFKVAD